MTQLTYTTIPAPDRAQWAVPLMGKNPDLSDEMTAVLNYMANKGWSFLRSETLPFVARRGLFRRRVEVRQAILIFYKNASSLTDADMPTPMAGKTGDKKSPMVAQTGGQEPTGHAPHITPNHANPKTSSAPPLTLNPSKDDS